MQHRGDDGRIVELEISQYRRHFERVRKEQIAGRAFLRAVRLHRIDISAIEQILVGIRIVLPHAIDKFVLSHHGFDRPRWRSGQAAAMALISALREARASRGVWREGRRPTRLGRWRRWPQRQQALASAPGGHGLAALSAVSTTARADKGFAFPCPVPRGVFARRMRGARRRREGRARVGKGAKKNPGA